MGSTAGTVLGLSVPALGAPCTSVLPVPGRKCEEGDNRSSRVTNCYSDDSRREACWEAKDLDRRIQDREQKAHGSSIRCAIAHAQGKCPYLGRLFHPHR